MQPKTPQRRTNFRKANRSMPRRRIDIALDALDYKNPDILKRFVTESGKITREIKRARAALLMR